MKKKQGQKKKGSLKKKLLLLIPIVVIFIVVMAGIWYVNDYYKSDEVAATYLTNLDDATVTKIADGYFFDGPGEDNAIIFYPGAKVEYTAYAPLMMKLAEQGIDCFLVEMPYNLAIFGVNKAEDIMQEYEYENWYLSGHSLGGAMAASFVSDHQDEVAGLILLAAYPTKEITDDSIKVLSIYGSKDGVLNLDKLEEGKELISGSYLEICIEGANHAGFGNYGAQKGDGIASMTNGLQQNRVVDEITSWLAQN